MSVILSQEELDYLKTAGLVWHEELPSVENGFAEPGEALGVIGHNVKALLASHEALRAENADLRKRLAEASDRERRWIDRLYALVNNGWQYAAPTDPNDTYDIYDENSDHIGSGHGLDAAIDDAMRRTKESGSDEW